MGYNTAETTWPETGVDETIKTLIDKFFNTLDRTDPIAGDTLADEIFSHDAKAQFGAHTFNGQDEIRRSRDHAWDLFKSRRHIVRHVYTKSSKADDIMFLGWVAMNLKNGRSVEGEFTGRLQIVVNGTSPPRISNYSIWADSAPLVKALQDQD